MCVGHHKKKFFFITDLLVKHPVTTSKCSAKFSLNKRSAFFLLSQSQSCTYTHHLRDAHALTHTLAHILAHILAHTLAHTNTHCLSLQQLVLRCDIWLLLSSNKWQTFEEKEKALFQSNDQLRKCLFFLFFRSKLDVKIGASFSQLSARQSS